MTEYAASCTAPISSSCPAKVKLAGVAAACVTPPCAECSDFDSDSGAIPQHGGLTTDPGAYRSRKTPAHHGCFQDISRDHLPGLEPI